MGLLDGQRAFVTGGAAAIHDWDLAEWQRIVPLNLTGVFHGFKAVAPLILGTARMS